MILACAIDTKGKEKTMDTVPIVNEFLDVFSEDLPRIPPSRAVDFEIEFELRMGHISKAPYRMTPTELKELKLPTTRLIR